MLRAFKEAFIFKFINFYPPFLGAGIRVKQLDEKGENLVVSMNLHFFNQNFVGTHFGGSLYAMCDPFFMIILMRMLGRNYLVWDKSAHIEYLRPGKGEVHAHFFIADEKKREIKAEVELKGRAHPLFEVFVLDQSGEKIARIEKKLWVKKKRPKEADAE